MFLRNACRFRFLSVRPFIYTGFRSHSCAVNSAFQKSPPCIFRKFSSSNSRDNQKGSEEENANAQKSLKKLLWLLVVSSGVSVALAYYIYSISKPSEVSWRVFSELLARGEVRSMQISRQRSRAIVILHSPQSIEGKIVFIVSIPFTETALDFETRVRNFEGTLGISKSDQIPMVIDHESPTAEMALSILLSSAVIATVAYFGVRRGLASRKVGTSATHVSLEDAIRAAFGVARQKHLPKSSVPRSKASEMKRSERDDSNFSGGFGSSLPFLESMTGISEIKPTTSNITFNDVAGMHASKEEVVEFVSYLRNPAKYQALGAKLPKGALLLGPPGTGKTLLVKALANEAGVPFYSMAGSEFIEVIGGLGASRIRKLFKTARQNSPSIIFIDEIDSVGRRRSSAGAPQQGGGGSEMEQTLNQLLVDMDGMDTTEGTIVFAATNRADLLDKALLRAGRFDRHIYVDLPNIFERKELLDMYIGRCKISSDVDKTKLRDRLATWTPGMSGADIARLCNEAALVAARRPDISTGILSADFDSALERIIAGAAKRSSVLSMMERRVAAVQEAGRALVSSLLPRTGLTPFRISIIPRAQSEDADGGLGFTQFVPDERRLLCADDIADRMAVFLAGRAAEQLIFKAISSASQRYLEKATSLAYKNVREWGMSESIGNLSFPEEATNQFGVKPYSKRTAAMIDGEVSRLITQAFQRSMDLIKQNEDKLMQLVQLLLANEVVSSQELQAVVDGSFVSINPDFKL